MAYTVELPVRRCDWDNDGADMRCVADATHAVHGENPDARHHGDYCWNHAMRKLDVVARGERQARYDREKAQLPGGRYGG